MKSTILQQIMVSDYIWQRLLVAPSTTPLGNWLKDNLGDLKTVPRYLIPAYFDIIITNVYVRLLDHSYKLMFALVFFSKFLFDFVNCVLYFSFVKNGSTFVKYLSLGSVQFAAFVKSAPLPRLSPNLSSPVPELVQLDSGETVHNCVTLSAGLLSESP